MYKLTQNKDQIIRLSDNAIIPLHEGNRDYNEFAAWVKEGNQPQEADPIAEAVVEPVATK